jgi:hypothetical protein
MQELSSENLLCKPKVLKILHMDVAKKSLDFHQEM